MRLVELFDKVASYNIEYNDLAPGAHDRGLEATFHVAHNTLNHRKYLVSIDSKYKKYATAEVPAKDCVAYLNQHFEDEDILLGVSFESEIPGDHQFPEVSTNILGLGNQFEVMATVLEIIKKAVQSARPAAVYFGAREASRAKLYKTMAKRFGTHYEMFLFPHNEVVFVVHV